jgi:hypothetical protein
MLIIGALVVFVALIALAWFLVLRRLDGGNFEVGRPESVDEQGAVHAWSAERQLEREEHAGSGQAVEESKDRNAARAWGG